MLATISKPNEALEPYEIEKAELNLKWKGQKQKLIVIQRGSKSKIRMNERDTEYKKPNPNLIFICNLANNKIYYNLQECDFWLMSRNTNSQEVIWNKLEDHDLETLVAFGLLSQRAFESTAFGERFYLGKRLKRKMELLNDRFHKKKLKRR